MPLDERTINQMWWSGFCSAFIESIKDKEDDAQLRIDALKEHIKDCVDCARATAVKALEGKTAARMRSGAKYIFDNRGDITVLPDFQSAIKPILDTLIHSGDLDAEFIKWMEKISKRYGKPYERRRRIKWR